MNNNVQSNVVNYSLLTIWMAFLCLAGMMLVPHTGWATERTVRIGVLAHLGPEKCREQWTATANYLNRKVPPYKFEVVPLTLAEIPMAVEKETIHFLLTNPSSFVDIEDKYSLEHVVSIRNRYKDKVYSSFGGVIFTRYDNQQIFSLNDLKGKRFMAVEPQAFGGWRVAWRELKRGGHQPGLGLSRAAIRRWTP